jgi:hypothetical protein
MNRLTDLTVRESLDALNSGECSSLDLTNEILKRIDEKEPSIQAFLTRTPELALQRQKPRIKTRTVETLWRGRSKTTWSAYRVKDVLTVKEYAAPVVRRYLKTLFLFTLPLVFENYLMRVWLFWGKPIPMNSPWALPQRTRHISPLVILGFRTFSRRFQRCSARR